MTKNSFVLPTKLNEVVAKLSDKQAGVLFKGILSYAENGTVANFEDNALTIAFTFVKQDMDYTAKKYAETCAKRAESGRLGGRPKKANESKKSKCFLEKANESKRKHNDNEYEYDNDINKNILTAPKSAGCTQDKPKRELNDLQKFSNAVIENFEAEVKTPDQKSVWFKRNCRCLRDILKFCGGDIPLAIETIDCCLIRLEKAGLSGGYEAVLRNIPDYYAEAKKKLGGAYA